MSAFPLAIGAVAALLAAAACERAAWVGFSARHSTYQFPAQQVVSVTTTGHRFIRVKPPGEPFDLVFDSRIDGAVDPRGYRRVFAVGGGPLSSIRHRQTPAGVVVCRTSVASIECGLPIIHGGDQWSMLFPASRKSEVVAMAERARTYLRENTARTGAVPASHHYRCADGSWLRVRGEAVDAVAVERPDGTHSLRRRQVAGVTLFEAGAFSLQLERDGVRWAEPPRIRLNCSSADATPRFARPHGAP